jgi:hypothetical protein
VTPVGEVVAGWLGYFLPEFFTLGIGYYVWLASLGLVGLGAWVKCR